MQTSCGAMQVKECLVPLYSSLSPPSFLFLPFSQNNSSFVPPLRCASSWRQSSSRGVWFDLLLFGVVKYIVIPLFYMICTPHCFPLLLCFPPR